MKIVKGDTVYLRSGKDAASAESPLPKDAAGKPMAEQIALANDRKNKDKSLRGKVLRVLPSEGKVIVEGLNKVTKHQRPRSTGGSGAVQQGGRIQIEAPIPVSRVMLVCPSCDRPTRVGVQMKEVEQNGRTKQIRDRVCKQCGEVIARPTVPSK